MALFNLISIIIGIVGIILAFVGFFLVTVPIGILGLVFGVLSGHKTGRNLNLAVIGLGIVRLMLGGGIL